MEKVKFQQVNLEDPFFTSLKEDYNGFEDWFQRKSDSDAYIQKKDDGELEAFLYLKIEEGVVEDVSPKLPEGKHLKVGTFKIDAHNTKLGEYFIQMDYARGCLRASGRHLCHDIREARRAGELAQEIRL